MSDEARVIGASYGVTEELDAPLKAELAHQIGIRELLKCPQSEVFASAGGRSNKVGRGEFLPSGLAA